MVSSGFARSNGSRSHTSRGRPRGFAGLANGCDAWLLNVGVEDGVLGFVAFAGGVFLFGQACGVLAAVDLLCGGIGGWRDSPEF